MTALAEIMKDAPFFAGLQTETLELVAGCGSNVQFEPGALIFREGEQADIFYLLRHGSVSIEAYAPASGPLVIERSRPATCSAGPGCLNRTAGISTPTR